MAKFRSLEIIQKNPNSSVFHLSLNRPSHHNALSHDFFDELPKALSSLDENPIVRVIVLSGAGKSFCSGVDLETLGSIWNQVKSSDKGRAGEKIRRQIKFMQDAITAIERCRKPVIASIHGACIGGGIDIITACDIRFCTEDAFFSVKEVDLAIAADLGTLQRLPSIVGYGNAIDFALTARRFSGSEAKQLGLVSRTFASKEELERGVHLVAEGIASKSSLAVIGTKAVLLRSKDLTLEQGLDHVATWNSSMMVSDDLTEAMAAHFAGRKPAFSKL